MVRDVQHNPGILQQSFTSLDSSASFWRSTETKNKSSSLFSYTRFTRGLTTMSDGKPPMTKCFEMMQSTNTAKSVTRVEIERTLVASKGNASIISVGKSPTTSRRLMSGEAMRSFNCARGIRI
eukprot:scaffold693_cov200-Alexandrium_tamarense.AAC.12